MTTVTIVPSGGEPLWWKYHRTGAGRLLVECDALALTLEADTEEEAWSLINEGLAAFFATHREAGTLEGFLAARGWTADPEGDVTFRAPYSLGWEGPFVIDPMTRYEIMPDPNFKPVTVDVCQGAEVVVRRDDEIDETPLVRREDLWVGRAIVVPTLVGYHDAKVEETEGRLYWRTEGGWHGDLVFDGDARHCWTTSYAVNPSVAKPGCLPPGADEVGSEKPRE